MQNQIYQRFMFISPKSAAKKWEADKNKRGFYRFTKALCIKRIFKYEVFYLLSFGLLLGCSPAQNSKTVITDYSGAIPTQESAVAAVKTVLESMDKSLPCGEHSFSVTKVRKTTESTEIKSNDEVNTINTIHVDEWGIEETVVDNSSNTKVSRY